MSTDASASNKRGAEEKEHENAPDRKRAATDNHAALTFRVAGMKLDLNGTTTQVIKPFVDVINGYLRRDNNICDVIPPFISTRYEDYDDECDDDYLLDVDKLIKEIDFPAATNALKLLLGWMFSGKGGGEFTFTSKDATRKITF
jgi:hypothetical protein